MKSLPFPSRAATVVCAALAAVSLASSANAHDAHPRGDADPFVGVWLHDAARVDCASGTVLLRFQAMQMIHDGGTLSDTNSAGPTTRGPGFGVWDRAGDRRYTIKFRYARYFPDGHLDGYTVVRGSTVLSQDGKSVTNASQVEIRDASDALVATGCARTTATRFEQD